MKEKREREKKSSFLRVRVDVHLFLSLPFFSFLLLLVERFHWTGLRPGEGARVLLMLARKGDGLKRVGRKLRRKKKRDRKRTDNVQKRNKDDALAVLSLSTTKEIEKKQIKSRIIQKENCAGKRNIPTNTGGWERAQQTGLVAYFGD